jgi:hypothetical protein
MKKAIVFFLVLILSLSCCSVVSFAHSGGTDSQGGHTDHSTGEYHYHHGYSAHQHPNGKCPFDSSINDSKSNLRVIIIATVSLLFLITVPVTLISLGISPPTKESAIVLAILWFIALFFAAVCFKVKPGLTVLIAAIVGFLNYGISRFIKRIKSKKNTDENTSEEDNEK